MEKQITELLEEDQFDGFTIAMEDKKMFFTLRDYWMEFTDMWEVACSGFMASEDKKISIL